MAYFTLGINAAAQPVGSGLHDKHYLRKHGKNAYYGQAKTTKTRIRTMTPLLATDVPTRLVHLSRSISSSSFFILLWFSPSAGI